LIVGCAVCVLQVAEADVQTSASHVCWLRAIWFSCADLTGLIAASFFTVLYNAFYCQPKTVLLYSTVNLVCGILGSYLPFQKWFNERRYKVGNVDPLD
jgi:adiponectin receptor